MVKRYKLKHPNDIPLLINKLSVNNLIKFIWTDNIDNCKKRGYTRARFSYFGDNLFYKFNPNIKLLKYIKNDILNDFLTLDVDMGLDDGLLKKALLIASIDHNYIVIDALLPKLDINKIYFDNMTILEFATKLFRNNDNFGLIETIILKGADINRPFRDGSYFFQNFLDSSTRMTISKITAINKDAFQLYKDEKMEEFYNIYFEYAMNNIDNIVYKIYIPYLLQYSPDITFKDYQYLIPQHRIIFIQNLHDTEELHLRDTEGSYLHDTEELHLHDTEELHLRDTEGSYLHDTEELHLHDTECSSKKQCTNNDSICDII
jgi:hypothetical protein